MNDAKELESMVYRNDDSINYIAEILIRVIKSVDVKFVDRKDLENLKLIASGYSRSKEVGWYDYR